MQRLLTLLMLRKPKRKTFINTPGTLVSLSRQFILMSVLAPTGELLSFASPKESSQRKGDPNSANFLRFSLLARVFEGPSLALRKRAASLPLPLRAYFAKSCDARGGITGEKRLCVTSVTLLIGLSFSGGTWADSTLGLPALVIPADNPQTTEKITLGRLLFNDKRLSADGSISCASCHQAGNAFSDGLAVAKGVAGQTGARNTPSVINAAFYQTQFLDGREQGLEAQALGPMVNPVEHGLKDHQAIIDIVRQDPNYLSLMTRVFNIPPQELTIDHVGKAIASFERTLIAGDSPFDRYYFGMEPSAISASAARGSRVFRRKGNCAVCHEISINNALFTDNRFYNIGVGYKQLEPMIEEWLAATGRGEQPDYSAWSDVQRSELGRYAVTKMPADIGQFKTPTLRNIALTAPYMHDGSIKTLEAVIEHYDKGGENSRFVDAKVFPLHLTPQEKADLLAFLQSLTSVQYTQPTARPAHE